MINQPSTPPDGPAPCGVPDHEKLWTKAGKAITRGNDRHHEHEDGLGRRGKPSLRPLS